MQDVIVAKGLKKTFGKNIEAVKSLTLSVRKGEVFGFLGPNGAGKTTSINMFIGKIKPTSGLLKILDLDMPGSASEISNNIGYVPQNLVFYDHLTVYENLDLFATAYQIKNKKNRINEILTLLQMNELRNRRSENMSGGQKRRLNLAIGLLHHPKILFLDEPSAGMDPQSRNILWESIEKLAAQEKITIILTTHLMETADRLSDRIAIIDKGVVQIIDTPYNLKRQFGNGEVIDIKFTNELQSDKFNTLLSIFSSKFSQDKIHHIGQTISVHTGNAVDTIQLLFDVIDANNLRSEIKQINMRENSLEDVFISLTGKSLRE